MQQRMACDGVGRMLVASLGIVLAGGAVSAYMFTWETRPTRRVDMSDLRILLDACVRLPAPPRVFGESAWTKGSESTEAHERETVRPVAP